MSSASSRSTGRSSTSTWCGTRRPASPKAFAFCATRTRGAPFSLSTTSMGSRSKGGPFEWTTWPTTGPPKTPMTWMTSQKPSTRRAVELKRRLTRRPIPCRKMVTCP